MREIKFRAWHKLKKKMMQVLSIELDPEFGGVEVWGKSSVSFETGEHESERDFWAWEDCEEMQLIGRKDKQGKEIYEDDILGLDDPEDHSRALVVFDQGAFKVKLFRILHTPIYDAYWDSWIVIGNKYEHPELMEGYIP